MKKKHCDVTGCGHLIDGNQIALQPAQVKVPGVGQMTVAVTFKGKRPDICNECILDAIASLRAPKASATVVTLGVKGGGR